jgi:hypothetical protein
MFQSRVTTDAAKPDTWHTLSLRWDLTRGECEQRLDDQLIATHKLRHRTLNGLSYLRIRSAAAKPDPHGVIIRQVKAQIADPKAPAIPREEQDAYQQDYVKTVVPRW